MDAGRSASRLGDVMASNKRKLLLKDQLELVKVRSGSGPDARTRYGIRPVDQDLTFEKGAYLVVRAIQQLVTHNKDTVLVGLAGPSGSGKTAFSARIRSFMPSAVVLSLDMYNDGSKVIDDNFDDPRITDYDTLLANIASLRAGLATDVPVYDFKQSCRTGYRRVEVPASRVIVLEGIYALSARLRPFLDLRVSITGGVHFDLVKRVLRDMQRSGQAAQEILQQVTETVYPMYKAFIEPDLKAAHIRIHNHFNPFSGFMSPTFVLKAPLDDDYDQSALMKLLKVEVEPDGSLGELPFEPEAEGGSEAPTSGRLGAERGERGAPGASRECSEAGSLTSLENPPPSASLPMDIAPRAQSHSSASPQRRSPFASVEGGRSSAGLRSGAGSLKEPEGLAPRPTLVPLLSGRAASAAAKPLPAARVEESEAHDIYLVPPHDDPDSSASWLRMRCKDGRYHLMFEEWVVDGEVIISPRVSFEVPVRILGGLLALGYQIGCILRRESRFWTDGGLTVKLDRLEGLERQWLQIQGKDREAVEAAGRALALQGRCVPRSYVEIVQHDTLAHDFQAVTDDLKRRFTLDGKPLPRADSGADSLAASLSRGSSPLLGHASFKRTLGFALPGALRSQDGVLSARGAGAASASYSASAPTPGAAARFMERAGEEEGARDKGRAMDAESAGAEEGAAEGGDGFRFASAGRGHPSVGGGLGLAPFAAAPAPPAARPRSADSVASSSGSGSGRSRRRAPGSREDARSGASDLPASVREEPRARAPCERPRRRASRSGSPPEEAEACWARVLTGQDALRAQIGELVGELRAQRRLLEEARWGVGGWAGTACVLALTASVSVALLRAR